MHLYAPRRPGIQALIVIIIKIPRIPYTALLRNVTPGIERIRTAPDLSRQHRTQMSV